MLETSLRWAATSVWPVLPKLRPCTSSAYLSYSWPSGKLAQSRKVELLPSDEAGELVRLLSDKAPLFPVRASQVEVLDTPEQFFLALTGGLQTARRRIALAALYVGTHTGREAELVDAMAAAARRASADGVQMTVLLDALRSTRPSKDASGQLTSTCEMLQRALMAGDPGAGSVRLSLYHTPVLRGLLKSVLPARVNEVVGVCHVKAHVFDDDIIVTGANLSNAYFTTRQDRYMVLRNVPQLADHIQRLLDLLADFSYTLPPRGALQPPQAIGRAHITHLKQRMEGMQLVRGTGPAGMDRPRWSGGIDVRTAPTDSASAMEAVSSTQAVSGSGAEAGGSTEAGGGCGREAGSSTQAIGSSSGEASSSMHACSSTQAGGNTQASTKSGGEANNRTETGSGTGGEAGSSTDAGSGTGPGAVNGGRDRTARTDPGESSRRRHAAGVCAVAASPSVVAHMAEASAPSRWHTGHDRQHLPGEGEEEPLPGRGACSTREGEGEEEDTWVFPLVQLGFLGIRQDEQCMTALVQAARPGSRLQLATAYLNLARPYEQALTAAAGVNLDLITASPQANGFYKASGLSGFIPTAYSLLAESTYRQLCLPQEPAGPSAAAQPGAVQRRILEYRRPGWQYHAKGLWYTPPGDQHPLYTAIGSPNFGYRSVHRDVEMQLVVVTRNPALRAALAAEVDGLASWSSAVGEREFQSVERRRGPATRLAVRMLRDFL